MRDVAILFLSFIFYAFLGWCFEMIHMAITTKEVVNRGFLNGPVIPIYGIGGLLVLILLEDIKDNVLLTTVLIVLICSVLEYATSYVMEKAFKIRWWDYTDKKLNLHGRICFETMAMFTIMALGVIYFVHPVFMRVMDTLSTNTIFIVALISLIGFSLDLIFSNLVLKKYIEQSDKGKRKDKTPAIREFTVDLIKERF